MSEEQNKPEEQVEVEPEAEPKPEPKPKPKPKPKPAAAPGRGLAVFALLLSLAVAGGGGFLWQQMQQSQRQLLDANAELQRAMDALRSADDGQQAALSAQLAAQEQQAAARREAIRRELQAALSSLHQEMGRDRDGWVRYEVEYLLAYANRRLQLDGDAASADAALVAADERLLAQADPALLPVRQAIADERRALAALPRLDIDGMVLELAALARGIDGLPLPGVSRRSEEAAEQGDDDGPIAMDDWRALGEALWSDLRQLVTVRTGHDQALPLSSPEQRFFLQQNLRLKLLAARLALLQGEQAAYRAALNEADAWLGEYFEAESAAVLAARETIRRLARAELAPAMPDISTSLRRLRGLNPDIFGGQGGQGGQQGSGS